MSNTDTLPQSRRTRKGSSAVSEKPMPRYGLHAILLTVASGVFLGIWGTARTFLSLCGQTCSYSQQIPLAEIASWTFLFLSAASIVGVIIATYKALTWQDKKTLPLIAVAVTGLLTGYVYSGAFQDMLASVVIRIMY